MEHYYLRSTAGHTLPLPDVESSSLSVDMEVILDPPLVTDNISFTQTTSMTLEGSVSAVARLGPCHLESGLSGPSDLERAFEGSWNTNRANTMTLNEALDPEVRFSPTWEVHVVDDSETSY